MIEEQKIVTMEDVDHVRLRPGNYIPNINYFIYELVDNSADEAKAGYGNIIDVSIDSDKVVTVQDRGRGLPIEPSDKFPDKSQAEVAFGSIMSGGKFEDSKSSGLNGIGSSGINFLSEYFNVEIKRDGKLYELKFEKGRCTQQLTEIRKLLNKNLTGTKIITKPDDEIWNRLDDFDISTIKRRLKQICYLNPGLTINFKCEYKINIDDTYCYEDGVNDYIKELLGDDEPLTEIYRITKSVPVDEKGNTLDLDVAFAYTERYTDNVIAFTNGVSNTANRSSNITGFKAGLATAIKNAIDELEINKNKFEITNEDTREGVVAIVSIGIVNPFYEGQGKDILNMPIVRSTLSSEVEDYLDDVFDKNPNQKQIICNRVIDAARVREAARKSKETARKTKGLSGGKVPGLTKASSKDPSICRIFLVEGDSAAGSVKQARNPETDAVLPVFGKINNTYNMSLDKILKSPKMVDAIKAFGCSIGDDFDIEKLLYHEIVIFTDADVDGFHIRCLWITFFFVHMRELIERGHILIALPPLFTIIKNPNTKNAEKIYAYSPEERDEIVKSLDCKYEINRNKGLGEQDWEELKESTIDRDRAKFLQITIEDAEECMRILDICMNDKSIAQRKEFIINRDI